MARKTSFREAEDEMKRKVRSVPSRGTVAVAVFVGAAWVDPAYAYVDPGTGSMIIQMLAAAAAASLFFLRSVREWIAARFRGGGKKGKEDSFGD